MTQGQELLSLFECFDQTEFYPILVLLINVQAFMQSRYADDSFCGLNF